MAVGEQRAHQVGLPDVRVLVLVEQDGVEARPVVGYDRRVRAHDLDRAIDLVPMIDRAELALDPSVALGRVDELHPLLART